MKLILLGAPGAGKGTQAEILSRKLNVPSISTGNILRAAIKDGTSVGLQAKAYIDDGRLVPDDVIIRLVTERLAENDCRDGFILDGMPRTISQAKSLESAGVHFDAVIALMVTPEEIVNRISGRRVCERCGASYHVVSIPPKIEGICDSCCGKLIQRLDDMPVTVHARLQVYHEKTAPLIGFYREKGILKTVNDAGRRKHDISADILFLLGITDQSKCIGTKK